MNPLIDKKSDEGGELLKIGNVVIISNKTSITAWKTMKTIRLQNHRRRRIKVIRIRQLGV